ncbi:MAG: two-component system, response regulator, stage 0 sporulation protein [Clostridia bacterium]|jgi:two-component system response regulator (stage 0 sporulation protein F)|nr:response regulator receiver protein [Clostridiales bacterium]MDK2985545.1 two-component system, response regulator, stage 0 sporulation protein [Clostridia bacterium]
MDSHHEKTPKVMIVDDQLGVRMLLEETFKSEDCCVLTAQDGLKALELLEKEQPAAIFIDYKMPTMNGLEVAKKIKEKGYKCKIVLMTAYGEIANLNHAEVNDYLIKPFDIQKARDILHSIL